LFSPGKDYEIKRKQTFHAGTFVYRHLYIFRRLRRKKQVDKNQARNICQFFSGFLLKITAPKPSSKSVAGSGAAQQA